jgi:hypothetical protein
MIGIRFPVGVEISLFPVISILTLTITWPPTHKVVRTLPPVLKWPKREANHSIPSRAAVKNTCTYSSAPPYNFAIRCWYKHGDKLPAREIRSEKRLLRFLRSYIWLPVAYNTCIRSALSEWILENCTRIINTFEPNTSNNHFTSSNHFTSGNFSRESFQISY